MGAYCGRISAYPVRRPTVAVVLAITVALDRVVRKLRRADFIDFLDQVEAAIPASVERVYAILDNLATHKAADVLLFNLTHPRWEFVFQPTYAAYLNLIEP